MTAKTSSRSAISYRRGMGSKLPDKIRFRPFNAKPKAIKWMVIGLLLFAGLRALLKGLGIWK